MLEQLMKNCLQWEQPHVEQGNSIRGKEWQRGAVMD